MKIIFTVCATLRQVYLASNLFSLNVQQVYLARGTHFNIMRHKKFKETALEIVIFAAKHSADFQI